MACLIDLADAYDALGARLYDPTNQFWPQPELLLYIQEAMRTWNALTAYWRGDFTFSPVANSTWYDITNPAVAPNTLRPLTLKTTDLYMIMEYHLLEPPVGAGPWTGSAQFTIAQLQYAVERRLNELLGASGCSITRSLVEALPGRTALPPATLDLRRVAFFPAISNLPNTYLIDTNNQVWLLGITNLGAYTTTPVVGGPGPVSGILLKDRTTGYIFNLTVTTAGALLITPASPGSATVQPYISILTPNDTPMGIAVNNNRIVTIGVSPTFGSGAVTLWQDDSWAWESFEPDYTTLAPAIPSTYAQNTQPLLTFDVDTHLNQPGQYELLTTQATQAGPGASLIVPDDWAWVIKWGALADLLGRESNAKDALRAAYCEKRYAQGMSLLTLAPALLGFRVNNIPTEIDSVRGADLYNANWEGAAAGPPTSVLAAGLNLLALSPQPDTAAYSLTATVVENCPVPNAPTDCINVTEDVFEAILDEAQHLAAFKMGGAEFMATIPMHQRFLSLAALYSARIAEMGEFAQVLYEQSRLEASMNPRLTGDTPAEVMSDGG
jgi:hypothetical protein